MPPGLIKSIADMKPYGQFVLVSSDDKIGKKWKELLALGDRVSIMQPEDLTARKLQGVSGIFINGGNQSDYLSRFSPKVLQTAHESGILLFGTSAGAMILGEFYFSAEHGGITSEEAQADPNEQRICIGSDFLKIKALKNTLVDSHYSEREREGRLHVFLDRGRDKGLYKGIGIDESTALCIHRNQVDVIGEGGVHFITKSTQGSSRISCYQGDTSSYSRVSEYLGRN